MMIIVAPRHIMPIRIPLITKDSLILFEKVNYPESSYSCAKGRMSQHIKKFT